MPKQYCIAMACDSKLNNITWCVISMKLSIVKKITGLEIMTLNRKKIWHVSRLIELMFKGELHSLQGCFRKQTGREDVYTLPTCLRTFFKTQQP